jgi:hypothetical protein
MISWKYKMGKKFNDFNERERELQAKTTLYALDYKKAAVMLLNHAFSVATSLNGLIGI